MSVRHVWVLLLLAAVFSMHGLQCVAADIDGDHGTTASVPGMAQDAAQALPVGSGLTAVGHQLSGAFTGVAPVAAAGLPQDGLPVHGATFWAVCFAVLLTGMLLLGVAGLIRRRPGSVVRARAPSALWHTGWSRLPRPPDLSALCLLRI